MAEANNNLMAGYSSLLIAVACITPAVAGLLLVVWLAAKKMRAARSREEQASQIFERSVMERYDYDSPPSLPPLPQTGALSETPMAPGSACALPKGGEFAYASAAPSSKGARVIEPREVLRRLQGIGQIAGVEGTIAICGGSEKGMIFRFSDGKVGLILPKSDTEEATAKYLKGYDYVFTLLPGGEISVSCRMADFVTRLVSIH
ncbi:MAG: hypothetical protein NTX50_30375 [Candidatus Sumerlaeota bacterium]|nr:hypothetical protein [Candidatus Sumerlaeota bacterium]